MKLEHVFSRGEMPRASSRLLPDGYVQTARNARLLTGDLEAWSHLKDIKQLAKTAPINTIALMARLYWLQWSQSELDAYAKNVDVVLGPVPGDTTYRTFLTGVDGPRVTNLDFATNEIYRDGAPVGAYPYRTLPLGVEAPETAPSVTQIINPDDEEESSIVKTYDGSDITDWTYTTFGSNQWSVETIGPTPPAFRWNQIGSGFGAQPTNLSLNISELAIENTLAGFLLEWDFAQTNNSSTFLNLGMTIFGLTTNDAPKLQFYSDVFGAYSSDYSDGTGQSYPFTTPPFKQYPIHVKCEGTYNETTEYYDTVFTFTWDDGAPQSSTFSQRLKRLGQTFSFTVTTDANTIGTERGYVDNISYTFDLMPAPGPAPVFTNYVYTYINSLNEESAPSPPSESVTEPDARTFNVVTVPAIPIDQDVTKVYLYRATTGATGTVYQFVDELPLPLTPYTDDKLTTELGETLISEGWDLPPADLQGLLALPNGIMAGFTGNQLCLTPPNYPHAWPVAYRLTTDAQIVGIGAIDTTVLIMTESHPYTAYGSDPAAFVMSKEEFIAGCESKRSIAYLRGFGILYASAEGIAAYAGQGRLEVITRTLFTREQWRDLNPSSIIGIAHDDRYFFFYVKEDGTKGGYILDQRSDGFGLIQLDFHATAIYVDDLTDTLYFVLDQGESYTSDEAGTVGEGEDPELVSPPANLVVAWNSAEARMVYLYRSKKYQLPIPIAFNMCQIKAYDYDDLLLNCYMDGVQFMSRTIDSEREFVIPHKAGTTFELELTGTSRVNTVQFVEDVGELT